MFSCYQETKLDVKVDFNITAQDENYTSPVKAEITNNTSGADFYRWTFEGGNPSSSNKKNPGIISYAEAGEYTVKLEAWNATEKDSKEITFTVDPAVYINFDLEVLINDFAPATIRVTNKTEGGLSYLWGFNGGDPKWSEDEHPKDILFKTEGEHSVLLEVKNGRETFSLSKKFYLKAALFVDFNIEASVDDFDYEVPFKASLNNLSSSALTYQWTASGGEIKDNDAENTEILFTQAGTYSVTLEASNEKEIKSISKEITVKTNTNLYSLNDIRFGVKAAENNIGCFYSLSERRMIKTNEVDALIGNEIDIVFFGLNNSFSMCYFTSPDNAPTVGFTSIPNASTTYFVNKLENTSLTFSDADFAAMQDDSLLRNLDIKGASSEGLWFTNSQNPRFILFETQNGIKGIIKIKEFVSEGNNSYILSDIKVQKQAN